MTEPIFDLESEIKRQTDVTLSYVRDALLRAESHPDFKNGIAVMRLKASLLNKRIVDGEMK